ncbi:MAG: hypothetical protein ABIH48_01140 [Candidatus Falkowbacteria bacterium]
MKHTKFFKILFWIGSISFIAFVIYTLSLPVEEWKQKNDVATIIIILSLSSIFIGGLYGYSLENMDGLGRVVTAKFFFERGIKEIQESNLPIENQLELTQTLIHSSSNLMKKNNSSL